MIMTTFPLTDCCEMLAIDPKTLRQWLRHSNMPLHAHPTDARVKCLTAEQVQRLASLHGRALQPHEGFTKAPLVDTSPLGARETPTHTDSARSLAPEKMVPTALLAEADLIKQLCQLETKVATMQEQLAQLALALLHERELRSERRLQALEALIQQTGGQEASRQELQTMDAGVRQDGGPAQGRRLHSAEIRARSRVLPLIEYGAHGTSVVICPQEGELPLTPDSPEWFDWLATLSSFRFVGQLGRFTAYRGGSSRHPSRTWSACRYIHHRNYKRYLGVTDRLTIDCLEQGAATLQSQVAAL
jgi:hypothetical protein